MQASKCRGARRGRQDDHARIQALYGSYQRSLLRGNQAHWMPLTGRGQRRARRGGKAPGELAGQFDDRSARDAVDGSQPCQASRNGLATALRSGLAENHVELLLARHADEYLHFLARIEVDQARRRVDMQLGHQPLICGKDLVRF